MCDLPGDLGSDETLKAQIEAACRRLEAAKQGNEVEENLLKACLKLMFETHKFDHLVAGHSYTSFKEIK